VASDPRQSARVLQVVRPAIGGMRAHVLQLAAGLRRYGFESELACPGDSDLVHDALEAGLQVHPVPIVGPLRPLRDLLAVISLAEVIRERKPALIHAHGSKAALIARIATMFSRRTPTVVTVHNQVLYGGVSKAMSRVYISMERRLAKRTSRIVTVSDALRREMLDVYGLPEGLVTTIHNGLDLAPFLARGDRAASRERYGVPADALVFGLAARFAPQKALDVLVDAAAQVLSAQPRAWLVVAGDGPLLEVVRTRARATAVRDRMLFPGFEVDVPGLLSSLDVYVTSSVTEGLSLALVEAAAAGLPAVATRVGGNPEVVDDGVTGLLVAAGKSAPLAAAIARLLNDPALRKRMGEAGRARALSEFSEATMLERTAAVYGEASG
jgi:glycosyltransferase involved in cell wall biosynthesis